MRDLSEPSTPHRLRDGFSASRRNFSEMLFIHYTRAIHATSCT
jgi:hypothetical protein